MEEHIAFIALGSNIGDRQQNLTSALELLASSLRVEVLEESRRRVTRPVGGPEQEDFLNMAVKVRTTLGPEDLFALMKEIEKRMHRKDKPRNYPRVIDLDLIFYGHRVLESADLRVPHPESHKRKFVMAPINDIDPDFVHPRLGLTVSCILKGLEEESDQKNNVTSPNE